MNSIGTKLSVQSEQEIGFVVRELDAMHEQPGWLVHDEQVGVVKQDFDGFGQRRSNLKMRFGMSEGTILSAGSGGSDLFLLDADSGAKAGMPVK